MPGLSLPLVAKLCAAAVVTTGVGVATYEVAAGDGSTAEVEVSSPAPEGLTFSDEIAFPELGEEPVKSASNEESIEKAEKEEKSTADAEDEPEVEEKAEDKPEESEKSEISDTAEKEEEDDKSTTIDTVAPELVILHPVEGAHFDHKKVVFEGESEPGAVVKAGPYVADVDPTGAWRIELILSPGQNRAVLTATDSAGNVSDASVTVHLDVEVEAKPIEDKDHEQDKKHAEDDEPKVVEFSAKQKWGYCEEEVPYDIFWGTATPNTVVHIVSAHGGAEVEVDKHGHWEKKVYFETAPRGDAFLVVVEAVNGRQEFEFLAKPLGDDEVVK